MDTPSSLPRYCFHSSNERHHRFDARPMKALAFFCATHGLFPHAIRCSYSHCRHSTLFHMSSGTLLTVIVGVPVVDSDAAGADAAGGDDDIESG
jgi:hypothetical protein